MNRYLKRALSRLLALLIAAIALPVAAQQQSTVLPEMGDSASNTLTLEQEQQIGREMMQRLDRGGAILDDPIVNDYINGVGRSLSSAAVSNQNHFRFFVLNARGINAFALPGGYIGVNSGLVLASESESELAAVIAHEIAHVTQRHIARSIEKANQMNLPVTAAVIAAILLGGEGDPQVANAAIAASLGGSRQMQLDFTRSNEKEADRVGMQLLAVSDYDPRGMANFFARMQAENRYYGSSVPEFLRTHPVTTSRIAEAEDRARQFPIQFSDNSIHYALAKARLRLLAADSPTKLLHVLAAETPSSDQEQEAQRYLKALALRQKGDNAEARQLLQSLLQQHPGRIAYIYELGQLEASGGRFKKAVAYLRQGLKQYPGNDLLTLALAATLLDSGEAEVARDLLETHLRTAANDKQAYRLLAEVEAASGNLAASHLAQAEYYYLNGEPHSAIDQLNTAKRQSPLPHYYLTRIEARLEQIKDELERHKTTK